MNKTKGIVMRTSEKLTVIFTDKGDFLEIPTPKDPPKLGQTIEVIINPPRISSFHNSWLKYSTAAILLLVLSFTAFYLFLIPNIAVASVSLDINHGIELLVNNRGQVIKARDVNGTSKILEGVSIKGLDVYQTVNLLIENAHNKGMFAGSQNLVLASVVPINGWGNKMIDTELLRNTIREDMILMNLSGNLVVGQTTQKVRREAQQQGMTVNSYLIYDRCEERGIAVQPDSLRNNVQKALMDAKVSVTSLFPEESLEVSIGNKKDDSMEQHQSPSIHNEKNAAEVSENTHDSSETSSGQDASDHNMPERALQPQPGNPSDHIESELDNEEHSPENQTDLNSPVNVDPQHYEEHSEGGYIESGHMEAHGER